MASEVTVREIPEKSFQQLYQKDNITSPSSDVTYVGSPDPFLDLLERDAESSSLLETMTIEPTPMSISKPQQPPKPLSLRDDIKTSEPNSHF